MKRTIVWFGLLLIVFGIYACAIKAPTHVQVTFKAVSDLNLDIAGEPKPITVYIFLLNTPTTFNEADFFTLVSDAEGSLGTDLLSNEQIHIRPEETAVFDRTLETSVRNIGLVAAYRDIDNAVWRTVVNIVPHATNEIRIKLGRIAVAVE